MRILLFGKNGQLGWELERTLACLGTVKAIDFPDVDFTRPEVLPGLVREYRPGLIVNAIAYTDVDKAEGEEEKARLVNAIAVGVLAEEARALGCPLVHYSTDYVFDGTKAEQYLETDKPHPINAYGRTKLEGERSIEQVAGAYLIFRTSWVYSLRKGGFVNKVLEWARLPKALRIVDDQTGSPTWARMLAEISAQALAAGRSHLATYVEERRGLYHLAGLGAASRFEWAKRVLELAPDQSGFQYTGLLPARSQDFPAPAKRPSYSALDCQAFQRAFLSTLPEWQVSLALALNP